MFVEKRSIYGLSDQSFDRSYKPTTITTSATHSPLPSHLIVPTPLPLPRQFTSFFFFLRNRPPDLRNEYATGDVKFPDQQTDRSCKTTTVLAVKTLHSLRSADIHNTPSNLCGRESIHLVSPLTTNSLPTAIPPLPVC